MNSLKSFRVYAALLAVALIFTAAMPLAGAAQSPEERIEQARMALLDGTFEHAITHALPVVEDQNHSIPHRREALQLIYRAYFYQEKEDHVRDVLNQLLELEPPLFEPNPNVEPLPLMRLYYDVRKQYSGGYAVERADPGIKTIAILDFENNSVDQHEELDPLRRALPHLLISQMHSSVGLKLVERERIQWLLDEIELSNSGYVDQETAVRLGKLLGAHTIVLGSFMKLGKQMQLLARVVKVETGEIITVADVRGRKDVFDLASELSLEIAENLSAQLEAEDVSENTPTRTLDAMMSYAEGLEFLELGEFQSAYDKFMEALEYDPAYQDAQDRAQSIKYKLG